MKRIFRENGLSIVFVSLFLVAWLIGQTITGYRVYNNDQTEHSHSEISYGTYLASSHFVEATMENWESEFFQMFLYVAFTVFLFQKGSSESKKLDEEESVDRDPRLSQHKKDVPWPVRKGGIILTLYNYSLSIAFLVLFLICFFLHAAGGAKVYNEEQREHGSTEEVSTLQYMTTSQFWFESFQNWQSEFLSVGSMVVFSIYLRQKGSPESKPVDSSHSSTGKD